MEVEVYYTEHKLSKKKKQGRPGNEAMHKAKINVYIFLLYVAKQRRIKDQLQLPQSNKLSAWDFGSTSHIV